MVPHVRGRREEVFLHAHRLRRDKAGLDLLHNESGERARKAGSGGERH